MSVASLQKTAIVTIVSNNYLHFARTMLQSAKQYHPDYSFFCVVVDRDLHYATELANEFEVISLERLMLPLGEEFLFQYNILELNTAVKPWAIEYLLERGYDKTIYVDPDIFFYRRMLEAEEMLSGNMDIVLTPHLLAPLTDDKQPRELDIRRAGAYNFGFCALRDSANTRNFLHWWQSKLTRDCVNDADRGLFVDQSWIDLVPGLFDNVGILRHKGYNVAYWNIAQRPLVKREGNKYFVEEDALVFFHFSGLNPANPESFSKHQDRFSLSTVGPAKNLVDAYVKDLAENGSETFSELAYGFGYFSSGEAIPEVFRKLYRISSALRDRMGPQPFVRPLVVCDFWSDISIDGVSPTNAMVALWHERRDLQFEFPMTSARSILAYYKWFVELPTAASYFSRSMITHHELFLKRCDQQMQLRARRTTTAPAGPGNEQRVRSLYAHILGRPPDEDGLLAYGEMCRTDAGFVRAWGEIGFSVESQEKRFLWLRMLKALAVSVCRLDNHATETNYAHTSISNVVGQRPLVGVFPVEPDVSTLGVWVTDRVVVPINARSGDKIRLEGIYFPESIRSQTGKCTSRITFLFGEKQIYTSVLNEHGNFTIECLVPTLEGTSPANLAIETERTFVPKNIGQGEDGRRLAWRMTLLASGNQIVFDCKTTERSDMPVFRLW
jgi:hypothetical protein